MIEKNKTENNLSKVTKTAEKTSTLTQKISRFVPKSRKKLLVFGVIFLVGTYLLRLILTNPSVPQESQPDSKATKTEDSNKEERVLISHPAGKVCVSTAQLSFTSPDPYESFIENEQGIIFLNPTGVVIIVKGQSAVDIMLEKSGITFEKRGDTLHYKLTSAWNSEIPIDLAIEAMSLEKDGFVISIFYDSGDKIAAVTTLEAIQASLKGGCSG